MRRLKSRKWNKGLKAVFFSDRSGAPFPYTERVKEPGTGLIVHRSESDGKWNRVDWPRDVIIPADAQKLKDSKPGFSSFYEE